MCLCLEPGTLPRVNMEAPKRPLYMEPSLTRGPGTFHGIVPKTATLKTNHAVPPRCPNASAVPPSRTGEAASASPGRPASGLQAPSCLACAKAPQATELELLRRILSQNTSHSVSSYENIWIFICLSTCIQSYMHV